MTNNNSSKYEWCDAAWQGAWLRWEFFGYGLHPNTLGGEFKIIDQIFGQTHRKNEHKSKLWEQCITGSVWHVVVAASPDVLSFSLSLH